MTNRKLSMHIVICVVLCSLLVLKYLIQIVLFLFPFLSVIIGIGQEASSIGIIGGADGPTVVFLSASCAIVTILPMIEFFGAIYVLIVLVQYRSHINSSNDELRKNQGYK